MKRPPFVSTESFDGSQIGSSFLRIEYTMAEGDRVDVDKEGWKHSLRRLDILENTVKSSLQALDTDRQKFSTINDKMMIVVKEAVAAQDSVSNLQVKVQTCTTAQEQLQRAIVKAPD